MLHRFLFTCAAALLSSNAGLAATFYLEPIAINQNEATGSAFELSINDAGTVAYEDFYRNPPDGSASDNHFRMRQVDVLGNVEDSFDVGVPGGATLYQSPILNDAGQVLVVTNSAAPDGGTYQELAILEADGTTKTVLAERLLNDAEDRPHIPNLDTISPSQIAVNANGDVAAVVSLSEGTQQILKFPGDGSAPVTVWDSETSGIFNIDGIDINSAGNVAFIGTELGNPDPLLGTTTGVYVGDGTTTTRVATADGFTISGRPAINDNGDVVASVFDGTDAGYLLQKAGEPPASPVIEIVGNFNTSGGVVGFLNLNDYGQVAYKYDNGIYIDGQLVLSPGDQVDGVDGTIGSGSGIHNAIHLRQAFGFNNLGQAVLGLNLDPDTSIDSSAVVRVNPEGATPDNPLVPFASTPDGQNDVALNIFNGLGVDAPIWVDPIVATGFIYSQGTGGANFASLIIPTSLPLGDDTFTLEFLYGAGLLYSDTLMAGVTFDFTAFDPFGVSTFSILGIDVAEMVDPTDPFVVGLTFVSGGFQSTLSIDAITTNTVPSPVPLPASGLLLGAALLGMGLVSRWRRRHG